VAPSTEQEEGDSRQQLHRRRGEEEDQQAREGQGRAGQGGGEPE